jgi:hypothetical protein
VRFSIVPLISRLPIGWAGRYAIQRLLARWRSLLTVIAGTLLSASVGALVPLYTTVVAQVGMVERLNQLPPDVVHASANLSIIAAKTPDFVATISGYDSQFRGIVDARLNRAFPGWLDRGVFFGETSALVVDIPNPAPTSQQGTELTADKPTRAVVAYYDGWPDAIFMVQGRLPNDNPTDADIEIVVPFEAQNDLGIRVGDVLILDQGGPRGGWPSSKNVRAQVVGVANVAEQLTPIQRGYFMSPSLLRMVSAGGDYRAEYPVLTTRSSFERVARDFVPDTPTVIGWRLLFDHAALPFARSGDARLALADLDRQLAETFRANADLQFNYSTGLINWQTQGGQNVDSGALVEYERSVRSLDAPFGLLLLQVGALVIFFLMVTASLVRRGERREIAMLQSRGALDRHIVVVRGLETLAICILAALAAPFVSQQVLIAVTPLFSRFSNVALPITPAAFVFSTAAAFVAFVALMATLRPVLRLPLITSGGMALRSDSPGEVQPWWQRYYLDLILVVLGLAALLRLAGRDTPLFTTTTGGRTTDPFLLLAPAFLFLGLGSILLRVFPVAAAILARLLAVTHSLTGPLAGWQVSREPVHYGRITFLLALAIGTGWFATSFRATINRSQTDQAEYKVGADLRFAERDQRLNAARARPATAYTQIPDVSAATVTWRQQNVNFQTNLTGDPLYGEMLALDTDTFAQVAYWRPDLGALNVPRPAGQPIALPARGVVLPFAPQKIGVWARLNAPGQGEDVPDLDRLRTRFALGVRLQDSAGTWISAPFKVTEVEYVSTGPQSPGLSGGGAFVSTGWAYLETDLAAINYLAVEPVRLVSFYWDHRARNRNGERGLRLTLAGLNGTSAGGQPQPLDLFASPNWEFAYDSGADSDGEVVAGGADTRRGKSLVVTWNQTAEAATVGLLLNYPMIDPVPMVASAGLIDQLGLQVNQRFTVPSLERLSVPFRIVASQGFYPTLYDAIRRDNRWINAPSSKPFAIADRDALLYLLNRRPSAVLYPDEVWLKTAPSADINRLLAALRPEDRGTAIVTALTLTGELANLRTDPLSLGLLGLMFLAFIIAMSLSIVGLLTYAALTASARQGEFGVLRALGVSSLRLIRQLAFEQTFVIGLGTVLGGALGAVLSGQVVPRLAQNATGESITPPFIVQVESAALIQYAGIIALVLALVLLLSLVLVSRLSLTRTLRLGEE